MRFRFSFVAGTIVLTCFGAAAAAFAAPYVVTDLGNLGYSSYANAINNNGQIVGTSYIDSAQTEPCAFLYDASSTGAKTMVSLLGSGSYSFANGINDNGEITGSFVNTSYTQGAQTDCYVYNVVAGTTTPISFGSGGQVFPGGAYTGSSSVGNAINDSGLVVGQTSLPGDTSKYGIAYNVTTSQGGVVPDPSGYANSGDALSINAVNGIGVYVGNLVFSGGQIAFYFNGSRLTQIPNPADNGSAYSPTVANDVNASEQIVGAAIMSSGGTSVHAYRYDVNGSGRMIDLGTLGGDSSQAQGIDSAGQVVGSSTLTSAGSAAHAFIYASSTEFVGEFWFGKLAKGVI